MSQTPTVGRIVHYVSYGTPGGEYGKECRAAIVTEVRALAIDPSTDDATDAWVVGLCVLNPTGQFFNQGVVQHEGESCTSDECGGVHHDGGTWHWPERV